MKLSVRDLSRISIFAALTSVGAFLSIPIGPVHITLQSMFVLLAGFVLGVKGAVVSQVVYLILGLIGIPVFSNFTGGIQTVFLPHFGFLLGFLAVAAISGLAYKKANTMVGFLAYGAFATVILYSIGLSYMAFILNVVMKSGLSFSTILKLGLFAFIPGDTLKLFAASYIGLRLKVANIL
jgi:biotin transport system substrate-specific component